MVDDGFIVGEYNQSFQLAMPAGLKGWCVGRYTFREERVADLSKGFDLADKLWIDPISAAALDPRGKSW